MEGQELFETFRSIVKESDVICNADARNSFFADHEEDIRSAIYKLKGKKDWLHLGLIQRVLMEESFDSAVSLLPLYPSEELCRALYESEQDISKKFAAFTYERACALKKRSGEQVEKYTDRHRMLESAIRMVWELFDSAGNWPYGESKPASEREARSFIAECYLLRSRLTLPKGETIPEKKLEALLKAWQWAERGDDLKIEIALERDRWDANLPDEWIYDQLESFLAEVTLDFLNPLHWAVNDRKQDLVRHIPDRYSKDNDRKILEITSEKKSGKYLFLPLYQARAAFRMEYSDISTWLKKAVDSLELRGPAGKRYYLPFTHPLWEYTVDLVQKAAREKRYRGQWENAVIDMWRMCGEGESRVKLSIQLRWYWSRCRQLYQLAHQAALNLAVNDPQKLACALKITDSQKSRPTIKARVIERFLNREDSGLYKRHIEADVLLSAGFFVAGLEKLKDISVPEKEDDRDVTDVPGGWAAVHFNIIDRDNAHALIVEDKKCIHVPVTISPLWGSFNKWVQEGRTPELLKELCNKSGDMLDPVLKKITADNIIFIPHSFLHLVPLHASRFNDGTYLFQGKTSLFLPYWSIEKDPEKKTYGEKADILLTNWKHPDDIKQLINRKDWTNYKKTENTADDFFESIEKLGRPPGLFVLFSHGQGNMKNVYKARFLMNNSSLTHQDIIQKLPEASLSGTRVILTACESDLVSGSSKLIDEHMSLASAFLRRGARETMGALFECTTETSSELILESKNKPGEPLYAILQERQNEWLKENRSLSDIAVFRVMGFPM